MRKQLASIFAASLGLALALPGCSTAPKESEQASFRSEAASAEMWFMRAVPGLKDQIASSAGYALFPAVGQWGIIFGGGQFGRGIVKLPDGTQIGWGAVNTGSFGLQAGVRGYKMLVVFKDQNALDTFKANRLTGRATGVAVLGEAGNGATAPFENGVALYQGASTGLIAGVNVSLDYLRFKSLEEERGR